MHLLIVSRQGVARDHRDFKIPGIRLVEELKNAGAFMLFDVPATLPYWSPIELLKTIRNYFSAFRTIASLNRKIDVYFYNFHIAYVPIYFIYLITKRRPPCLFLADGQNCIGMRLLGIKRFLGFFYRIISLPCLKNDNVPSSTKFIWYPGCADITPDMRNIPKRPKMKLLYNSSFLVHNAPERLLEIANKNPDFSIYSTGYESDFRNYLQTISFTVTELEISRVTFLGNLSLKEYFNQAIDSAAIILIRDESQFENATNFPSKFIEAIQLNVPLLSGFNISGVPDNLYFLCENLKINSNLLLQHRDSLNLVENKQLIDDFLVRCSNIRLKRWLYKPEQNVPDFYK